MKLNGLFRLTVAAIMCLTSAGAFAFSLVVAGGDDRQPLAGAALMTANGTIKGLTDERGAIALTEADLPATVRYMGYDDATLTAAADTVFLSPRAFELSEMVVQPEDRPVLKLRCYIREYTSAAYGTDTLQLFGEYMSDYFLPAKKVKGFKSNTATIRVQRQRMRHRNAEGLDSISRPTDEDEFLSWAKLCGINPATKTLADSVREGCTAIVPGKQSGDYATLRLAPDGKVIYTCDLLADHKGHHWEPWIFKLLGMTIDATEMRSQNIFTLADDATYGPSTLQMCSYAIGMTIKSKWVKRAFHTKEPIKTYSVIEIYPVEAVYLTVEDAKVAEKEYDIRDITPSPLAPPLPANITEMLEADV